MKTGQVICFLLVLLLAPLFNSCSTEDLYVIDIQTKKIAQDRFVVIAANKGISTVYLTQCTQNSFVKILEIKIGSDWVPANYTWPCPAIYGSGGLELLPGISKVDTLIMSQLNGEYRFLVPVSKVRDKEGEFYSSGVFVEN